MIILYVILSFFLYDKDERTMKDEEDDEENRFIVQFYFCHKPQTHPYPYQLWCIIINFNLICVIKFNNNKIKRWKRWNFQNYFSKSKKKSENKKS